MTKTTASKRARSKRASSPKTAGSPSKDPLPEAKGGDDPTEPSSSSKTKKTGLKPIRTYRSALAFLAEQTNYERRLPSRRDKKPFTLDRPRKLLADLGNPHDRFRSVHIAGTKGKGSTAAMLSRMLQGNGMQVGLFCSPHIMDIRERITINEQMISEADFTNIIAEIAEITKDYDPADKPTFFEILTAIAFVHFANKAVDIAVVETGLGGRLDATNVLNPVACAITNISLDHTQQLGNTLEDIAREKAGIFKEGVPTIVAPQPDEIKATLKKAAENAHTPLLFTGEQIGFSYRFEAAQGGGQQARICISTPTSRFDHLPVPLVGQHQAINCGVALGVLDQLKSRGFQIDDEAATTGLAKVRLEGRMEMLCESPRILVDGAHNAASIEALMRAIGQNVPYDSMVVIFGCCADKDIEGMLRLILLGADKIIFTKIRSPRSADPEDLANRFSDISGRMAQVAQSLEEAVETAEKAVTREDLICVTGSFYLVSEAKRLLAEHPDKVPVEA